MRRILIPLDGSHFAEHAVPYAVAIARRAGAAVELVSVAPPPFSSTHVRGVRIYDDAIVKQAARAHRQYLDDCARRIGEHYGMECTGRVRGGSVFEQIAEHVATSQADLVVMTTHGGGSPSESWLGSVTDRMVREATVPVLLVRPTAETDVMGSDPELRRILVPSDGSRVAERVVGAAVRLAELFGGEVLLVGVVETPTMLPHAVLLPLGAAAEKLVEREEDALRDHLLEVSAREQTPNVPVTVVVRRHPHPATALSEVAATERVDMIAMATHGRGGVRRVLLGSVADKVLRASALPMLLTGPGVL